ncbi:RICIN domain-containing protein [Yinghuangia sp. YIM S09857]|uniref:RICIN domain-containing protein n=1 Tax=Yinghuangia sp. YIM S09857 TaxID=3436929 RepID=UPI003F5370BC
MSLLTLMVAVAPPSSAGLITKLRNLNSSLCISPPTANWRLQQVNCANASVLDLTPEYTDANGTGWWHIRLAPASTMYFGCITSPGTAGAPLVAETCGKSGYYWTQLWTFEYDSTGNWFRLRNFTSGMCIGVPGGSTQPYVQLIVWGCGPWWDHYWGWA